MKRLLALLLALCLMPCVALAEMNEDGDVVVTTEGARFIFTPPEGAYMLTLESSASEVNALGLSQREVIPWMEEYDIVVLFFDEEFEWELHILTYPCEYGDYDDMGEVGMERECGSASYAYRDQGWAVISSVPYRAPGGHQFVCVETAYTYEDGMLEAQLEYFTVKGGCMVSVYMISYTGEVTDEQRDVAQAVADSLWIMPQ